MVAQVQEACANGLRIDARLRGDVRYTHLRTAEFDALARTVEPWRVAVYERGELVSLDDLTTVNRYELSRIGSVWFVSAVVPS